MANNNNNAELNLSHDWDFEVNLAGLVAPSGKGGNVLPSGYYAVLLNDLYINLDKNPDRVIIKCAVADGPFMGAVRTTGLAKPKTQDDKVRYYWRALAESAGYTPAQLDKGEISLGPATFKGRTAHVYYVTKEDSEDGFENLSFLAPAEWATQKAGFEANGGMIAKKEAAPTRAPRGSALGGDTEKTAIPDGPSSLGDSKTASAAGSGQTKAQILKQLGV